jgi:UrcA family protein
MYTKSKVLTVRSMLSAAAAVGVFSIAGSVAAKDKIVTDSVRVSPAGLDLTQPPDARTFYTRLEDAAWIVCTRGTRVGLLPPENQFKCYQNALGEAVHASNKPLVTQIYLATHTLQEAAAHGIDVPAQVAAK